MTIDPDDFIEDVYADLSNIIDNIPVDYKKGGFAVYTPEQLHEYSNAKRNEELVPLFIIDITLTGLTLIFSLGAWL